MIVKESIQDTFKGPTDPAIHKKYEDEKEKVEGFLEYVRSELNMINHGHIDDEERHEMRMQLDRRMDEFWYTEMSEFLQDEFGVQWSDLQNFPTIWKGKVY